MTARTMRRIIGITALVLWGIALVSRLFLNKDDILIWQSDRWALLFAVVLTLVFVIWAIIKSVRNKNYWWKVGVGFLCVVVLFVGLIMILAICFNIDKEVWRGGKYVVYAEYRGLFDGYTNVLYKRNGLVERRQYDIFSGVFLSVHDSFEYIPNEEFDYIEEYVTVQNTNTHFERGDTLHFHIIYRLSDGHQYWGDIEYDSIQRLIENNKQIKQTQI